MTFVNPVEKIEKKDLEPKGIVKRWLDEIEHGEKEYEKWRERASKIKKRYKEEHNEMESKWGGNRHHYNVLWSNIQTLQPTLYARTPKPEVKRRFQDKDPVGRVAAQILERATSFTLDDYDFDETMRMCRDDYLLVGRGTVRVRYEPEYEERKEQKRLSPKKGKLYTEDGSLYDGNNDTVLQDEDGFYYDEPYKAVTYESVRCEYVHHLDFGHSSARTWNEVRAIWFKYYMSYKELEDRFGKDIAGEVQLNYSPRETKNDEVESDKYQFFKKAVVYEIWDKDEREVIWIAEGRPEAPLSVESDPLGLSEFFPIPRPLLATKTNDSLVPIPDFVLYQDQANELDDITARINDLVKAIRLAGVYDTSCEGLQRLMDESVENKLIPVKNWPNFAAKGGFNGAVQFMPIKEAAAALQVLYDARERSKADLYEITGMSDIIRGNSNPNETATAQQIKGQFATLRISDRQAEVQRFAKDVISLKAEIIAEHFDPQLIAKMSGAEQLMTTDDGVAVHFEQAIALLKNDLLREFRIDIETDSTIAIDEQMEKQGATEYISSVGGFIQSVIPITQSVPELAPIALEMLSFASRRYKAGEQLETLLDRSIEQIMAKVRESQNTPPEPPQPDPATVKAQMDAQIKQAELQMKAQKDNAEMQIKMQQLQQAMMQMQAEFGAKSRELVTKEQELQLKAEDIRNQWLLERAKFINEANDQTLEDLGLETSAERLAQKITEVEFYTDPTSGNRRARAITSKESQPGGKVTDVEFYTDEGSGNRRARAVTSKEIN